MPTIVGVRPVLLSAPYGSPDNLEVQWCLRSGYRTTGLVEITLDDGTTGLGEGYLAVFAPHVFVEIVKLIAPYLVGKDASDLHQRYREMCMVTDYWSLEGAARHVVVACEIAAGRARQTAGRPRLHPAGRPAGRRDPVLRQRRRLGHASGDAGRARPARRARYRSFQNPCA